MAKKTVRFNYFKLYLINKDNEYIFDFEPLLEFVSTNKDYNYSFKVNMEDKGEVDTNAFLYDESRKIYSMQIAKLRDYNIPDKKKVSAPREDIPLDPDEFVSEFLTLIYDRKYNLTVVQINRNSLTSKELDAYLTQLRSFIREKQGKEKDNYYIESRIVPDNEKLNEVKRADYFRKFILKGSKINLDSLVDENSLRQVSKTIGDLHGVNFKLEISVESHAAKDETLDREMLLNYIEQINETNEEMQTEIAIKQDIDTSVELINLVNPRMTDYIKIEHDKRKTIALEFLYNQFMEKVYDMKSEKLNKLLG